MARSRNIKPSIMENEDLADLTPIARLLFIYLWMLADREGRLEDRPKRIAGRALPYDRDADVDGLLNQLAVAGFIIRYKVGDQSLIHITNFSRHQSPHVRETASELPGMEEGIIKEVSRHDLGSASPSPRSPDSLFLIPDSLNLKKPSCSPSASESADDGFASFWKLYPKKVAKPQAVKAWRKTKPTGQLLADLLAGLERHIVSADWQKDGGQFIPHPATWLNARRWEDEPDTCVPSGGVDAGARPKAGDTRTRHGVAEVFTDGAGWVPA